MRVGTNIGNSERNRGEVYGGADGGSTLPDSAVPDESLAGRVIPVDDVAEATVDAILRNRLYVVTHDEVANRYADGSSGSIDRSRPDERRRRSRR